jgi:hypothetical protein
MTPRPAHQSLAGADPAEWLADLRLREMAQVSSPTARVFIRLPGSPSEIDAIAAAETRGGVAPKLHCGPDGYVRGSAEVQVTQVAAELRT